MVTFNVLELTQPAVLVSITLTGPAPAEAPQLTVI